MTAPVLTERCDETGERTAVTNAAVLGSLGVVGLAFTAITAYLGLPGLPCLFRAAFSLPCPGCGMTRSIACLWHADAIGSLRYHPLGPVTFAALIIGTVLCWTYVWVPSSRRRLERALSLARQPAAAWTTLALVLGVWAFRLLDAFVGWRLFSW